MNKVFVYRNLTKKCFSLKDVKTRKVIKHTNQVIIKDVEFKVSIKGRDWVRQNKKKIVHAGVQGQIVNAEMDTTNWVKVRYNPYTTDGFVKEDNTLVTKAEYVLLTDKGMWAYI